MSTRTSVAVAGSVTLAAIAWAASAQVGQRGASALTALTAASTCGISPVAPPGHCIQGFQCTMDGWVEVWSPAGTACNDDNACTYSDVCVDNFGTCRGAPITCLPCETCNGTSVCAKRTAGTPCPTSTNPCEAVCDGVSPYCQPL